MYEFSIGNLSKRTGCKIPTIRYYEDEGLLESAFRTEGNQRRYNVEHLKRLNFIVHARELGFTLDDVRELIALSDNDHSGHKADLIATKHLQSVEKKIVRLQSLSRELRSMLDSCSHDEEDRCFVIETLFETALFAESTQSNSH